MSVSYITKSSTATGADSCTLALPSRSYSASTEKVLILVSGGSPHVGVVPTLPAGWTRLAGVEGGEAVAYSLTRGKRFIHLFLKDEFTGSESGELVSCVIPTGVGNTISATAIVIGHTAEAAITFSHLSGEDSTNDKDRYGPVTLGFGDIAVGDLELASLCLNNTSVALGGPGPVSPGSMSALGSIVASKVTTGHRHFSVCSQRQCTGAGSGEFSHDRVYTTTTYAACGPALTTIIHEDPPALIERSGELEIVDSADSGAGVGTVEVKAESEVADNSDQIESTTAISTAAVVSISDFVDNQSSEGDVLVSGGNSGQDSPDSAASLASLFISLSASAGDTNDTLDSQVEVIPEYVPSIEFQVHKIPTLYAIPKLKSYVIPATSRTVKVLY